MEKYYLLEFSALNILTLSNTFSTLTLLNGFFNHSSFGFHTAEREVEGGRGGRCKKVGVGKEAVGW
jgi:hypothetical protein